VFALLSPLPSSWVNNPHFKGIWNYLKRNIGSLLYEIDTDPEHDQVFVVDRGHVEGYLYRHLLNTPERYCYSDKRSAERQYMLSKTPLKDYLQKQTEFNYSLPDVIFPENVPLDRVSISTQQSLLEEQLGIFKGDVRSSLINQIKQIPELDAWFESYKQREGSLHLEGSRDPEGRF
jgi:hypothetical protein